MKLPNLPNLLGIELSPHGQRVLKVVMFFLKIAISVYILWRIAGSVSFGSAFATIFHLPPLLFLALALISVLRHLGQFCNWLCSLRVNPEFHESKAQVFKSYLLGLPLRFAIPGGHANMAKIFYVRNTSRMASLYSTLLERSFLTWANWTFASGAAVLFYLEIPPYWFILAFALLIFYPEAILLTLGSRENWRHLKPSFSHQAAWMILLQVGGTLLTYTQYWLLLKRYVPLSFMDSSIRMALTQFSNSIPITIAGLGLRESFAIHFLKDTGITAQQAVSATLGLFLIHDVVPALIGLPFLIRGKRRATGSEENTTTEA